MSLQVLSLFWFSLFRFFFVMCVSFISMFVWSFFWEKQKLRKNKIDFLIMIGWIWWKKGAFKISEMKNILCAKDFFKNNTGPTTMDIYWFSIGQCKTYVSLTICQIVINDRFILLLRPFEKLWKSMNKMRVVTFFLSYYLIDKENKQIVFIMNLWQFFISDNFNFFASHH